MEKSWEIGGVAATWKMTVAILDPEHADPDLPAPVKPETPDFEGLVEHFRTLVDLTEAQWQLAQLA